MLALYRLLWIVLTPVTLAWSLQQTLKRSGGLRYLLERFGVTPADSSKIAIWFHAASLGELRLANSLIESHLEHGVLLTCNTPDAYRLASEVWGDRIALRYCPLDYIWSIRGLLKAYRPRIAVIIETEIWPELYHQCQTHRVPVYIVNGRIGAKTLGAGFPIRQLYRGALAHNTTVWARSEMDREHFVTLGCPPENSVSVGSIKMSGKPPSAPPAHPIGGLPYHLAVSTHQDEELLLAKASREALRGQLLVVIPRHPQRGTSIARRLKQHGFSVALRSEQQAPDSGTDVYIADTAGEVSDFCAHASWVFVGGSLVDHGGHNVFEPAIWGKAIFIGPHVQNFSEEVAYLKSRDAIVQVRDPDELSTQWTDIRENAFLREKLEGAVRAAYQNLPDHEAEYISLLKAALNRHHKSAH
jgi:3-deoxy-D-manno-octulosonic-acid transferase